MKYTLLIMLSLFSTQVFASTEKPVYLYIMFHDDNTNGERFRTKMDSMEQGLVEVVPENKTNY